MKITNTDAGVRIVRDSGEEIDLTEDEAQALGLNVRLFPDPPGSLAPAKERYYALRTLPVDDATLSLDAHHSQAILRIEHGALETAFVIPIDKLVALRDALTRKIEQISRSGKGTVQ